jgi:putative N-acetylmannosamine-6-phosphate epimerase
MNKLLHQLREDDWTLLVSLPRNDVRLAEAAIRGGAQGLKVHLNVDHHASGTHFGSWAEEKENLQRILEAAGEVPVGIVPGGTPFATLDEFREMAGAGIDFFDAYPADAPAWTLEQPYLNVMLAAYAGGTVDEIGALEQLGMEMCEASIVAQTGYGEDLTALDLARYADLAFFLDDAPIIVPSQKNIRPADLPALRKTGVKGVLIGAIVTGREPDTLEAATRAFREATVA